MAVNSDVRCARWSSGEFAPCSLELTADGCEFRCAVCAVEFDAVALRPTYKLLWGAVGQSNALDIAAGLGVPKSMLQAARAIMEEELSNNHTNTRTGALMVSGGLNII
eukprot:4740661-Pyramimonas_sp.AAC.1